MCSFMLICQCRFAIVKVLLKKVTYLLSDNKLEVISTYLKFQVRTWNSTHVLKVMFAYVLQTASTNLKLHVIA